jgi:drug/metabolite transporter (DMT)-like permease
MSASVSKTVTYRIVRISPLQTTRIATVMWVLMGIPYAFFAQFPMQIPHAYRAWIMVGFPLLYGLLGCVLTLLSTALYNLIAPRLGGFVYTVRMPLAQETEGKSL